MKAAADRWHLVCIDGFCDGRNEGCKRNEMSSLLTWLYMKELAPDLLRET